MSNTMITGDGRVYLNEYRTYKELARVADQSAMDTNPEKDKVSFDLKGSVHVDVDFTTPATMLTITKGEQDLNPLDSSPAITKVHYFTRERYEEKGSSVKVTWDNANTFHHDNTSYTEKDAKIDFYASCREFTVSTRTGRISKQSLSENNHWIIPDYAGRQKDCSWHQ